MAPSTAAAIISATAAAVTAAVKLSTPPKAAVSTPPPAVVSPTEAQAAPAATLVAPANGGRPNKAAEGERRRPGKKQGRRDQPAEGAVASSVSPPPSAAQPGNAGKIADDDNEEPWVVVGSRAGAGAGAGGAAGVKQPRRKKGQRGGDSGSGGVATLPGVPGGGGGASVVEWASESSPASTARAVVVSRSKAVSPSPSRVPSAPRVSPQAPPAATPVQAAAPSGGGRGGGNGNPWRVSPKTVSPPQPAPPGVVVASPVLAANGLRSATGGTSSAQFTPQRPGPGPGSVWGASAPMAELRTKPLFATVAPLSGVGVDRSSRAPGPRNRAGVIGPPQAASSGGTGAAAVLYPLGSSALLPAVQVLAHRPLAASINQIAAAPSLSGNICSGDGVIGDRQPFPAAAVPLSASPTAQGEGGSGAVVRSSSSGADGEALVENEKLVSYLMETGSILALAQRLEEEEEWRRAVPSPANSGPG